MLFIIFHHVYLSTLKFGGVTYLGAILKPAGFIATGVFLFLSGYGMYYSINKKESISLGYIANKMTKLLLPYWYAWIVYAIIMISVPSISFSSVDVVSNFFTLGMPLGESNWFFRVIVGVYLLSFIVFKIVNKWNFRILIITILSAFYMGLMLFHHYGSFWYNTILCYPMGLLFAHNKQIIEGFYSKKYFGMFLLLSLVLLFFIYYHLSSLISIVLSVVFSLACAYILQFVKFNTRCLRFIGINSLLFYFMQAPSLRCLDNMRSDQLVFSVTTMVMTFVLASGYTTLEQIFKKNDTL